MKHEPKRERRKYLVRVADRKTGEESTLTVDAVDERHAEAIGVDRGWLVSGVEDITPPPPPPPPPPPAPKVQKPPPQPARRPMPTCSECGGIVSRSAKTCPRCGKDLRAVSKAVWGTVVMVVVILMCAGVVSMCAGVMNSMFDSASVSAYEAKKQPQEDTLREFVTYYYGPTGSLSDQLPMIQWIEVEENNVYIGFSEWEPRYHYILEEVALDGNARINFGVHVWAVPWDQYGWRPGDGFYYDEVTARYGKIRD